MSGRRTASISLWAVRPIPSEITRRSLPAPIRIPCRTCWLRYRTAVGEKLKRFRFWNRNMPINTPWERSLIRQTAIPIIILNWAPAMMQIWPILGRAKPLNRLRWMKTILQTAHRAIWAKVSGGIMPTLPAGTVNLRWNTPRIIPIQPLRVCFRSLTSIFCMTPRKEPRT